MSSGADTDLCFMSIAELAPKIRDREVSPVEVARAMLRRIDQHDAQMRAYITVIPDVALAQATEAEREIRAGRYRGPLHGVTVSLKDNISTRGIRTSCGSRVNPEWVPEEDATVYRKLREAGATLVGKANLLEYAFSVNPHYPPPRNPWHLERTAAGSSSGSGVSVAAGMAHCSIGSDTGGSGRAPANANGCVGFKATYGRVSRWGVFPLSYSLDHVSTMSRSVKDSAVMLQAVSGHDPRDENSVVAAAPDYSARLGRDISGLRIGVARGFTYEDVDDDVIRMVESAAKTFRSLGADVEHVDLPYVRDSLDTYTATMLPEAATVHYDNLRRAPEGFGTEGRRRLDLGNVIPATAYVHAQRMRKLMRDSMREVFSAYDVIISPVTPTIAGALGAMSTTVRGQDVNNRHLTDGYTNYYSLIGAPAIAIPGGFSRENTPIGLQIAGKWFDEQTVLQVAHAYEQSVRLFERRPPYPA